MTPITYIDRASGFKNQEKVYGEKAIQLLYGDDLLSKVVGAPLLQASARIPLLSHLYGWWQSRGFTKKKIKPFIENFDVDFVEFAKQIEEFDSFQDFFIRKLKPEARPISSTDMIIPADGRYYFYQDIDKTEGFIVKNQKFDLSTLLGDAELAEQYAGGSMVMGRLCPCDYHRFHFPCDCTPGESRLINGLLYSVNPVAVKRNLNVFVENKRYVTKLETKTSGTVLYLDIGATNVGSIIQTFKPHKEQCKGNEKGYFSFGGSALILLFKPGTIVFDKDLIEATQQGYEMRCLLGQSMGRLTASHFGEKS